MSTKLKVASLALGLALCAQAVARADEALDAALDRMAAASGDDYVAARKAVVAREGVQDALDKELAGQSWTDDGWKRLAMATIAESYLAHPDVVAKVNHLEGVDATHYLARRRPEPECARELHALGAAAVGPMLELYLKTFDSYPFTRIAGAANPFLAADLAAKERIALRVGLVVALSRSAHPAAFFVCRDVARSGSEDQAVRSQAIEGLGDVGTSDAFAELGRLHADATLPASLRLAAIRGVGAIPTEAALEFLTARLSSDSADERRTAVVALGSLGSAWAWEARGAEAATTTGDRIRREAAAALVGVIDRLGGECGDRIVDALATIAHESSLELLERKAGARREGADTASVASDALARVKAAVARNAR